MEGSEHHKHDIVEGIIRDTVPHLHDHRVLDRRIKVPHCEPPDIDIDRNSGCWSPVESNNQSVAPNLRSSYILLYSMSIWWKGLHEPRTGEGDGNRLIGPREGYQGPLVVQPVGGVWVPKGRRDRRIVLNLGIAIVDEVHRMGRDEREGRSRSGR